MNNNEKSPKIETGATDFEKQEGKENKLDAITNDFLENAHPDEIRVREIEQEELQTFLETATIEEKNYAESLMRLKGIQYKDWTEQGFPMTKKENKEIPATIFSLNEHDAKMMEILRHPDTVNQLTDKEAKEFKKWEKDYQGIATSDEQAGETQKFITAHQKLLEKKPEKHTEFIQTLVSRAFPEYYCKERPWKNKGEKKEDVDISKFKMEQDYAA
jgi:hypothetical protein